MEPITLFEYDTLDFTLSDVAGGDSSSLRLTDKMLDDLEALNKGRFLDLGRKTIRAKNFVGIMRIKGLSIQILPKVLKDERNKEHRKLAATNLLAMLSHSGMFPDIKPKASDLDSERYDLFEIFIRIFAEELHRLIHSTRSRDYIRKSDELRFVKGTINTRQYTNPARMHIIPCTYYDFSVDTLLNRTLKYTCHLMARSINDDQTIRKLRSITDILDQVTLTPVTVPEVDRICFTRLNSIFEPSLRMCRIFLSHSTLTLQASHIESFALMIAMEELFEKFVSAILKDNPRFFFGYGYTVHEQEHIGHLARSEKGRVFQMKPDIIIRGGPCPIIIDTKYKLLKPDERKYGVSQADMYQMYAYAKKTNAKSCMLLYPEMLLEYSRDFTFDTPDQGEISLCIRSAKLSHNLLEKGGMEALKIELKGLLKPLLPKAEPVEMGVATG